MGKFKVLAALLIVSTLAEVQSFLIESRMLGSKDADQSSHPYHVGLYRQWLILSTEFVGSGALLTDRWLVTSAKVAEQVNPISLLKWGKVKAGLERVGWNPVQELDVEKVILHDFYNSKLIAENDIALVKVASPGFVVNEHVNFIALPVEDPQGQVVVTSWHAAGKKKKPLQELSMDLKDKVSCGEALKEKDDSLIDQTVYCVENTANRAVCADDLGSPAISVNGDQQHLVGIFTWVPDPEEGQMCSTLPAVFTNVSYYNNWITNNML